MFALPQVRSGELTSSSAETKLEEAVADKGYHKASTLELAETVDCRTYIPEAKRKYRYRLVDKSAG